MTPASIDLLVSNTQLNSDGATTVTLSALVKDSANRAIKIKMWISPPVPDFWTVTNGKTDANGTATPRWVQAGESGKSFYYGYGRDRIHQLTKYRNVTGTTIDISGLNSLSLGDSDAVDDFPEEFPRPGSASLKDNYGNIGKRQYLKGTFRLCYQRQRPDNCHVTATTGVWTIFPQRALVQEKTSH